MHADFFKSSRPRHANPTFQSNLVQSTMVFPYSKSELLNIHFPQSRLSQNNIISMSSHNYQPSPQNYPSENAASQTKHDKTDSVGASSAWQEDPYRHKRSKSNLSSYGSSSLGNLGRRISDKNVFENQQKDFNIVTLCPKEYKQSIKMFPKFRNEIQQDSPHQARKAFISGKPEVGLRFSRLMRSSTDLESQRTYKSTGKLQQLNPENK